MMDRKQSIALLDNGSLRPESVFSLRRIAADLSRRLDCEVNPVSLLHSSKIAAEELDGVEAQTWKRFLKRQAEAGVTSLLVLPLFFGPSSAVVDYLPRISREILEDLNLSDLSIEVGPSLVDLDDPDDDAVARILADLVLRSLERRGRGDVPPPVILVDHGSPVERVAQCRDRVAEQLAGLLAGRVSRVIASSMERREGEEYAFNEPLLESALQQLEEADDAVLSLMFVSPGRHAGPGGDIAQIVEQSAWARAGKRVLVTPLVGESPLLIDLLERRFHQLVAKLH